MPVSNCRTWTFATRPCHKPWRRLASAGYRLQPSRWRRPLQVRSPCISRSAPRRQGHSGPLICPCPPSPPTPPSTACSSHPTDGIWWRSGRPVRARFTSSTDRRAGQSTTSRSAGPRTAAASCCSGRTTSCSGWTYLAARQSPSPAPRASRRPVRGIGMACSCSMTSTRFYQVPAAGGPVTSVALEDGGGDDTSRFSPRFLPDGRRFLVLVRGR